jgi:hypothetical protein
MRRAGPQAVGSGKEIAQLVQSCGVEIHAAIFMAKSIIWFATSARQGGRMRCTLKLVLALAAFIIIAIAVQDMAAFIRTPGVVARVEQSGNLPLELIPRLA